jgi:hypothetical protein
MSGAEIREEEELGGRESTLVGALRTLPLFEDMFLRFQAQNLHIVDQYLRQLERELHDAYVEQETTPTAQATVVSALSQLWVFGVYELLRTWRQRAWEFLELANELSGLPEAKQQRAIKERVDRARRKGVVDTIALEPYKRELQQSLDPGTVSAVRTARDRVQTVFRKIEALRMNLAKHEIPKANGARARAPGYARVDPTSGSMSWEIDLGNRGVDAITRLDISNAVHSFGCDVPPSGEAA